MYNISKINTVNFKKEFGNILHYCIGLRTLIWLIKKNSNSILFLISEFGPQDSLLNQNLRRDPRSMYSESSATENLPHRTELPEQDPESEAEESAKEKKKRDDNAKKDKESTKTPKETGTKPKKTRKTAGENQPTVSEMSERLKASKGPSTKVTLVWLILLFVDIDFIFRKHWYKNPGTLILLISKFENSKFHH